ncbi:hemolysin family protein [Austwickia chelonae]|uniref:hemolysin family protein n=1 Tax=Austwickia chelonae TaxID=100225 RepID=UPI000E25C2D9|nr:hemolysin family protein [Austwickia chelonae]
MTELALLLLSLILVAACGLFVAAEFAFLTIDRNHVESRAAEGDSGAGGVLAALRTLSTQLSGAQLGITITNLAIGFLSEPALATLIAPGLNRLGLDGAGSRAVSLTLAMLLSTTLTMVFGELVPKNLAIAIPERTARAVQAPMRGFTTATKPMITLLNGSANRALRRMGIEPTEELASARSPEELHFLVARSAREGTLPEDTAELVQRSIEFGERRASDVMTPRTRVDFVHVGDSVADVVRHVHDTGHARFPVLDAETDRVVGLITTRQILRVPAADRSRIAVTEVMDTPVLVPGSIDLDSLLGDLRDGSQQIAVVIDEYGGVDGIVTLEDLIEEITGELEDEHDTPVAPRQTRPGIWEVSGLLRPDEVEEVTGVLLPEDAEYETLAGLIVDQLNRLAELGDVVEVIGQDEEHRRYPVTLTVTGLDALRVDRVRIHLGEALPDDENTAAPTTDERR